MNTRKTALTFALIAALSITAYAQNASDFKTDGKGTITAYTGTDTVIVIPSKIGSETIKAIGENAFMDRQLTSVTIPHSVKFIYDWAFKFNILTSITIGANVELVKRMLRNFQIHLVVILTIPTTTAAKKQEHTRAPMPKARHGQGSKQP